MIVRICFDVHGTDEDDVLANARRILADFTDRTTDYRLRVEVTEEAPSIDGTVALWRGEVVAVRDP